MICCCCCCTPASQLLSPLKRRLGASVVYRSAVIKRLHGITLGRRLHKSFSVCRYRLSDWQTAMHTSFITPYASKTHAYINIHIWNTHKQIQFFLNVNKKFGCGWCGCHVGLTAVNAIVKLLRDVLCDVDCSSTRSVRQRAARQSGRRLSTPSWQNVLYDSMTRPYRACLNHASNRSWTAQIDEVSTAATGCATNDASGLTTGWARLLTSLSGRQHRSLH